MLSLHGLITRKLAVEGGEVKSRAQSPSCKPPPLNLVNSVCADCPALGNPELPGALLATEKLGFFFWSVFYLSHLEFTHCLHVVNTPHNVHGLWERSMCISLGVYRLRPLALESKQPEQSPDSMFFLEYVLGQVA